MLLSFCLAALTGSLFSLSVKLEPCLSLRTRTSCFRRVYNCYGRRYNGRDLHSPEATRTFLARGVRDTSNSCPWRLTDHILHPQCRFGHRMSPRPRAPGSCTSAFWHIPKGPAEASYVAADASTVVTSCRTLAGTQCLSASTTETRWRPNNTYKR